MSPLLIKNWISEEKKYYMIKPTTEDKIIADFPSHLPAKMILKISMINKDLREYINKIFDLKIVL